jgi:hypothetical protein
MTRGLLEIGSDSDRTSLSPPRPLFMAFSCAQFVPQMFPGLHAGGLEGPSQ